MEINIGILEYDKIKECEMKEGVKRKYLRRTKFIMGSRLNAKNEIRAMNPWAVSLMLYGAGIVRWTKSEI